MNPRPALTLLTAVTLTAVTLTAVTGCAAGKPVALPSASPSSDVNIPLRALLSARAAQASVRYFTGSYTLTTPGSATPQTLTLARSAQGFRLDIASGGSTSVLMQTAAGTFQCSLGGAVTGCNAVAAPGASVPAAVDPRWQHVVTDWAARLTDPSTAISVTAPADPPTKTGNCFQVDPVSASMDPVVDAGVYCFDTDGTLTGLRLGHGTLVLTSVGAPPATLDLPAPVSAPSAAPSGSSSIPPSPAASPPVGPTQSPQAE